MIPSPSSLLLVYRVDIVDKGVLIFVRVCNFYSWLSIGWGRVGRGVYWDGWDRTE